MQAGNGPHAGRRPWVAALVVALFLAAAPAAAAHPYLTAATPQAGVVAPAAPTTIQLGFTEGLVIKGCSITVTSTNGQVVRVGKITPALGGVAMSAAVPKLAEGIYTVHWVAYGDDGHTVEGAFHFGVPSPSGQAPPGASRLLATTDASAESAPTESLVSVAGRWLAALAAFALVGGAALFWRLRGRIEENLRASAERRWTTIAPAAVAVALIGTLLEAYKRAEGPHGVDLGLLSAAPTGVSILVRLAVLALAAFAAGTFIRRAKAPAATVTYGVIGAAALAALAIDGHVATVHATPVLAAIGQILHLLSGGVWMGAVIVLAFSLVPVTVAASRTDVLLAAVRAYAPVAIVAAAVTIVTGLIAAVREVSRWYFLRWSSYGHILIVKVVVVAGVLALGGATTLLARRALARGDSTPVQQQRTGWFMRAEAIMAVATIAIAALLAGTLQGRGQPLPSQRGNLLPGAGFANVALPNGTGEMVLAPARVGLNRIIVTNAQSPESNSRPPVPPRSISVALACGCEGGALSFHVTLHPGSAGPSGAWSADVGIPRDGTYSAELEENGRPTIGSPTFSVGDVSSPGSTPVTVASVADLSGPDALDCRSQEIGALIAIELINAAGGYHGNKVRQVLLDDQGSASLARTEALQLAAQHPVAFLAPCGQGAQGAISAVGNSIPTIVADDNVPVTPGAMVLRMAPNPFAEGYAAGQYVARIGLPSMPHPPHRVAALIANNTGSRQRLAGLEDALAPAHVKVDAFPAGGPGLTARLKTLLPAQSWLAIYADGNFTSLTAAMRTVGAQTSHTIDPTPIIVSQRLASERFVVDGGDLGVEGQVRALTDVDPTTKDAALYAQLVPQVVGELATVPGLSGFVAGQALAYGLIGGDSPAALVNRLRAPGVFSRIATSPWDDKNPALGTLIFRMLLAQFLPDNLIPAGGGGGAASESYAGQFFLDGAWEPASPELFSPLPINLTGPRSASSGSAGHGGY